MDFTISFDGQSATRHLIPARDGTRAINELTKSVLISSEYLVTGRVRQKYPFEAMNIYLEPPQEGSWRIKCVGVLSSVALGVGSSAIWDFSKYVLARASGQEASVKYSEGRDAVENAKGSTEAVINNVKPHLRAAHDIIGAGANSIVIVSGTGNTIHFDSETKKYVNSENLDKILKRSFVGVGMLNANSRFGKVFDYELNHLVTIEVAREVSDETMVALGDGLSAYLRGVNEPTVVIEYMTYRDHLGRPTRYLVLDAEYH
jgi:hypothetical protein